MKEIAHQSIYPLDASLTFAAAAPQWLSAHQQFIKPNTLRNYRNSVRLLTMAFGDLLLKDIRIEHVREYQAERSKIAGPPLVNSDTIVLQQVMKHAGEWTRLREFYKPLRVPTRGAGHSLTQEEESHLRKVAFSKPKWRLAAHCMTIVLSTTMGFGELRQLRRRDVNTSKRSVLVREGAKNRFRDRTIPLNSEAFDSMTWILERWKRLGGHTEEHYILPHRPRTPGGPWFLDEPMGSIATAFTQIRIASGLQHFRLYDCRVQAITKLLSNPTVSVQVCREIAGHVSQVMTDRYSIQRFATKKAAVDTLEDRPPQPSPEPAPIQASSAATAPLDLVQPTIQAEIDRLRAEIARLADRQFDLALRESPSAPKAPETQLAGIRETAPEAPVAPTKPRQVPGGGRRRVDFADPEVQAEIRRQVDLALQERALQSDRIANTDRHLTNIVSFPYRPA